MTNEKMNRYFNRTVEHIHRVQKNMLYLVTNFRNEVVFKSSGGEGFEMTDEVCRELMYNVMKHDQSKFNQIQFRPYIELTEYHHQRKTLGNKDYEYPNSKISAAVDHAVRNHYYVENHHPERMEGRAEKMSPFELIEVVCDLQAMAQEFNEGSCRGYFIDVWIVRNCQYFYDDHDWYNVVKPFMCEIITLFERGIDGEFKGEKS